MGAARVKRDLAQAQRQPQQQPQQASAGIAKPQRPPTDFEQRLYEVTGMAGVSDCMAGTVQHYACDKAHSHIMLCASSGMQAHPQGQGHHLWHAGQGAE